jgi:hypothetical protein
MTDPNDKFDIKINQYYSLVDKNLITNLCKNNNLKNLINLSTVSDLYIFNKKNKKWFLKSKDKLLKECENIKKKEIKSSSSMLSNLAKLNKTNEISEIKGIYDNLQTKISNIDNIINCLQLLDTVNVIPINYNSDIDKSNIVSFDPVLSNHKPVNTNEIGQINLININHDLNKYNTISDSSDSFIECYSNC